MKTSAITGKPVKNAAFAKTSFKHVSWDQLCCRCCWVICSLILFVGCGGGTSGTGLSTYEGVILNADGTPSAGAKVKLVQNHDTAVTDSQGAFEIVTPPLAQPGTLSVTTDAASATVQLKSNPQDGEQVKVSIKIGDSSGDSTSTTIFTADEIQMSAKIVGLCEAYFENNDVIRQSNHTPNAVTCTLKAKISSDGQPQSYVRVAIQSRSCEANSPWITEESGLTESGLHQGVLQLEFHFYSSLQKCQYRVIAPYHEAGVDPIIKKFQTFAEKEYQ